MLFLGLVTRLSIINIQEFFLQSIIVISLNCLLFLQKFKSNTNKLSSFLKNTTVDVFLINLQFVIFQIDSCINITSGKFFCVGYCIIHCIHNLNYLDLYYYNYLYFQYLYNMILKLLYYSLLLKNCFFYRTLFSKLFTGLIFSGCS